MNATLEFEKELIGKETALIICAKPGLEYTITINSKKIETAQNDGLIEIKYCVGKGPAYIKVYCCL